MTDQPDDWEALAAEYVLGTLDGAARAEAEQRRQSHPGFARLVEEWERRLAPLADGIAPVEPPAQVWAGVQQGLTARRTDFVPRRPVVTSTAIFAERVAFWRWCAFGAGALAAALAGYVGISATRPELVPADLRLVTAAPAARYVAVLGAGEASPSLLVSVDPVAGQMTIRPLLADPAPAGPDQALELWLIAGAERPPRSLGLLDPTGATALPLNLAPSAGAEPAPAPGSGTVLAVSLEPRGGSPTGLPTGPVIYQGPLLALPQ